MLSRRETDICPCCGQRILMRHGVKFSPRYAAMFDMIERAGKVGTNSEVLASIFYPSDDSRRGRARLKTAIYHMNNMLAGTDIELRAERGGHVPNPYRVQKRRKP